MRKPITFLLTLAFGTLSFAVDTAKKSNPPEGSGHTDRRVIRQTMPQALEWVWQGYKPASPAR